MFQRAPINVPPLRTEHHVVVKWRTTAESQSARIESLKQWLTAKLPALTPSGGFASAFLPLGVVNVGSADPSLIAALLRTDSRVEYADPVVLSQRGLLVPNDANLAANRVPLDWIKAIPAWDITTGAPNVLIGIIDSGIPTDGNGRLLHEDLNDTARYSLGVNLTESGRMTDRDDCGHGTHVTGIVAALTNNGVGIAGMNWQSPVRICKVFDYEGEAYPDVRFLQAVEDILSYAAQRNLTRVVINYSAGGAASNSLLEACQLIHAKGALLCAAIGNDGTPEFPAAYASRSDVSILAVGATERTGAIWGNSAPGASVVATGDAILSAAPPNGYCIRSGTSGATPFVTGVASLVWSAHPGFSNRQVLERIRQTAVAPTSGIQPDMQSGWGLVDAARAVAP